MDQPFDQHFTGRQFIDSEMAQQVDNIPEQKSKGHPVDRLQLALNRIAYALDIRKIAGTTDEELKVKQEEEVINQFQNLMIKIDGLKAEISSLVYRQNIPASEKDAS